MIGMKNKIGILVPTYNRLSITKRGITKLMDVLGQIDSDNIVFEIIIIDDGSTDGTPEWLSAHVTKAILLNGDGSLWWSGAINVGAQYCIDNNFMGVLLWNDDITPRGH
jgi:glycosyltransferase involved in cell wall biosynthesis